jgi:high-affinity Fe2+/Pb2+ permease
MAIDLSVLATLVQTIVITLTLLVFIFQFRSQEKAIRESSYQNVLRIYNDYVMSSTGTDDLILARLFSPAKELTKEEIAGFVAS